MAGYRKGGKYCKEEKEERRGVSSIVRLVEGY